MKRQKHCFDALADLISRQGPLVAQQSRFVLIPGPDDVGIGQCLPQEALPSTLTQRLKDKLNNVTFSTSA
jgi:hypothetical protein